MPDRNRRFLLRERPSGRIGPNTFELSEEAVPEIKDGEALVRVDWISLDPTNRTWINDTPTYLPPVGIGEVMRAGGLGHVVESKNPNYSVGQIVQGLVGWQEYLVASDTMPLFPVDVAEGVSPSTYMGALGTTGLTAWIGIRDIGKPQPGETVVVSAAAGAVGSIAGQLAKADGARVVGIAGGPESAGCSPKNSASTPPSTTAPTTGPLNSGRRRPRASMSTSRTSAASSWTRYSPASASARASRCAA